MTLSLRLIRKEFSNEKRGGRGSRKWSGAEQRRDEETLLDKEGGTG
jgi:hypothetical protein